MLRVSRSETTGYAPFFLNYGWLPRTFNWNTPARDEYPSVRVFAQRMKLAVIAAHDAIIDARVKQTRSANKKRRLCQLEVRVRLYKEYVLTEGPRAKALAEVHWPLPDLDGLRQQLV